LRIPSLPGTPEIKNREKELIKVILRERNVCLVAVLGVFAAAALSGCLVAGVSSNGGAFIWPGGIGLLLVVLVMVFLIRRR
jgi:hypothetical protein